MFEELPLIEVLHVPGVGIRAMAAEQWPHSLHRAWLLHDLVPGWKEPSGDTEVEMVTYHSFGDPRVESGEYGELKRKFLARSKAVRGVEFRVFPGRPVVKPIRKRILSRYERAELV